MYFRWAVSDRQPGKVEQPEYGGECILGGLSVIDGAGKLSGQSMAENVF